MSFQDGSRPHSAGGLVTSSLFIYDEQTDTQRSEVSSLVSAKCPKYLVLSDADAPESCFLCSNWDDMKHFYSLLRRNWRGRQETAA